MLRSDTRPQNLTLSMLALTILIATLPWAFAPLWPTQEIAVDLKWPYLMIGISVILFLSLFERPIELSFDLKTFREMPPFQLGVLLIVVGLLLSTIMSPAPGLGLKIMLRELALLALAVRLATMTIPASSRLTLFSVYLGSAGLQALFTFYQFLRAASTERYHRRALMVGTFGNPEYVAGWLAPAFAMGIFWAVSPAIKMSKRVFLLICLTLIGLSIFLSGGRGASVGALVAIAVGVVFNYKSTTRRSAATGEVTGDEKKGAIAFLGKYGIVFLVLGLVALTALTLSAISGTPAKSQSLTGRMSEVLDPYGASSRHRIGLLIVTSRVIASNPVFGCGPGRFGAAFDLARGELARTERGAGSWVFNEFMNDRAAGEAHCDPLQWWAEYGLLPILGFLLIVVSALSAIMRSREEGMAGLATQLILVGLVTLGVQMLFNFPLHRPVRAVLFWTLIGLAHSPQSAKTADSSEA